MTGEPKMLLEKFTWLKLSSFHFSSADFERKYRSVLTLLAIAAVMYACVGIFYNILSIKLLKSEVVGQSQDNAPVVAVSGKHPADFYAVIPQRNLFGSADKSAFEKKQSTTLPVEGLDISLIFEVKGTVAGTGKDGFAVIEEKGKGKQVLYKVGNIVAGAKIINIMRNAVAFRIGNTERILKMAETKEAPILPPRQSLQPATASGRSEARALDINDVSASLKDMGAMLSQAQIRPYYSAGAPDGFMVTNIKPGSIYEKMGLSEGDIIQGADDRRLITADDMTAFYNSIKSGSSFTLRIKRGGQQENLQYVFR